MFKGSKTFVKRVTILMSVVALIIGNNVHAAPDLTTYNTISFGAGLKGITRGSDGAMWFTEANARKLGKITPDGVITEYTVPNNNRPDNIITGPDGAIWFTAGGTIARTTNGNDIVVFSNSLVEGANYLTVGSDNAIWFTEYWNGSWSVGRMNMSGNVTHHPFSDARARLDVTLGSDGALWFIEYSNSSDAAIGRMTMSGQYSSYPVPTYAAYPSGITSGSDGALWFTETNVGKIGRMTTSGEFSEYGIPNDMHPGSGITSGPDGALWFVSGGDYSIFRMTTSGEVTSFQSPGGAGGLTDIASDGDDSIWFVNSSYGADGSYIGRLRLDLKPAAPSELYASSPAKSVALKWHSVEKAANYQIFRDDVKIGSSSTPNFVDNTATDGTHSYYVLAVSPANIASDVSNKLDILVDNAKPNIGYSLSSAANANGWNNTNVTITFTCNDGLSGIQSCSSPVRVAAEGLNQESVGTATDNVGNTATTTVKLNIDKTAPTVSNASMTSTSFVSSSNQTLTANASDSLSGVTKGEYFIDTDPGKGRGSAMAYSGGKLKATTTISDLSVGQHKLFMRSQDAAGNWSTSVSVMFTSQAPTLATVIQNAIAALLRVLFGIFLGMFLLS